MYTIHIYSVKLSSMCRYMRGYMKDLLTNTHLVIRINKINMSKSTDET